MKILVNSKSLYDTIAPLLPVIQKNPILPALECLLLEVKDGNLHVRSSDLRVECSSVLGIEAKGSASFAVPAAIFSNILHDLPEQVISITLYENNVKVNSSSGEYKISIFDHNMYPPMLGDKVAAQDVGVFETDIASDVLIESLDYTLPFVSRDELRPSMGGVLIDVALGQEAWTAVSTNANVIGIYGHNAGVHKKEDGTKSKVIVPFKSMSMIYKLLKKLKRVDDIHVSSSDRFISLVIGDITITSCVLDAEFPNFERAIPTDNNKLLRVDRVKMLDAVLRTSSFSSANKMVILSLSSNTLLLTVDDVDLGNQAKETLSCVYDSEDMDVAFNVDYIVSALRAIKEEQVVLAMSENKLVILQPYLPEAEGVSRNKILIAPIKF